MNKKTTFILTLLGSGIAMFLIFYLYPARIFDVELIGSLAESSEAVTMKAFLRMDADFQMELQTTGVEMKRQLSGWMILFICLIGLPAMIAYRVAYTSKSEDLEEDDSENQES